ncbi:MAG: type VI secretion system lipoprotein TssJ [Oceanospirillaceae bacterium]|nr:type VI secretion system lipoprotein TssJ [Oceanospirillaceae bacterium]
MRFIKFIFIYTAIITSSVILSACKTIPTISFDDPDKIINISISANSGSNPDLAGRPSPTVIKIYQLSSDGKFKQTDFFTLYDDDSTLSSDVLEHRELLLASQSSNSLLMTLDPKTQYIGITAAFQQSNNAKYKLLIPIGKRSTQSAAVKLLVNQLVLSE